MATTKSKDKDELAGNQPSSPKFGHDQLKEAEESSIGRPASSSPSSTAGGKTKLSSDKPKDSKADELSSDEPETSLYKSASASQTSKGRFNIMGFGLTRRRGIFGGSIVASIIALIIAFLSLLPLKIEHIISNLQNHFFATSQNAVQKETQKLFVEYTVKHVLPGYRGKCGSTIDKNCSATGLIGTNPVDRLYKSWSQARLENRLASQFGIEFKYNTQSGHWFFKAPGTAPGGDDIGADGQLLGSDFKRANRAEMRAAFNEGADNLTFGKKVMYRYKVGRLLEEKYGIKRCIVFCGTRDAFADKVNDKKIAAKLLLTERVIVPRNETIGIALKCLISDCVKKQPPVPTDGIEDPALVGQPEGQLDTDTRRSLVKFAATYGVTDPASIKAIEDAYKGISEKGFKKYLTTVALEPIIGEAAAGKVSGAIPVAGWINLAAQIVKSADNAGPTLKKIRYTANAYAAVQTYMMYRTYADEVHTGHPDATELGSFTDSLSPGNHGVASDPELGGTAGAEDTPLYHDLIDNDNTVSDGSPKNIYKCNDGKPVPKGEVLCPEEVLAGGNGFANAVHNFLHEPGIGVITTLADLWNGTVGKIFGFANDIIAPFFKALQDTADATCSATFGALPPGYCPARDLVNKFVATILQGVTNFLIPNPFSTNMSGGRTFDMIAAGADVAGNNYAQTGLGGQALSPNALAAIMSDQEAQDREQFAQQSLATRLFSSDSPDSLVSKMAVAMPSNLSSFRQSGIQKLLNPFAGVSKIFGFSGTASAYPAQDPFGVTQYGYPDAAIPDEQSAYWDKNCSDNVAFAYAKDNTWNQAAADTTDDNTGMPVNKTTNPCLLIMNTVGIAGGSIDSSLLTADDLADQNSVSGNGGGTPQTPPTGPTGACTATKPVYGSVNGVGPEYSQGQLKAIFGDPGTATSHPQMDANLVSVDFLGHSAQINKVAAGCLTAVAQEIKASGNTYQIKQFGCYRFDSNNGTSNIGLSSYHTYGAACDINWDTNPFVGNGAVTAHDMPDEYVQAFNHHGFTWGGNWHSVKDYMHFEFNGVTP